MHTLTSNILDFQVRKYFSMPEVMEKAPLWGCSFWGERMFSCVHHPGWIQLFLPQCLNYKKEVSSMGKEREWWILSAFSWAAERNRHFLARFASYQNVWIKQFICLLPLSLRLDFGWLQIPAVLVSLSDQVRWDASSLLSSCFPMVVTLKHSRPFS